MIGHIYIYGEIANFQSEESQSYGVVSLKSVVDSIQSQPKATEYHVHIHSIGGDVVDGLAIYDILKATGKSITTINEGACYSIATAIYLAGEKRLAMPHSEFLIHEAWGGTYGNADDMKQYASELDKAVNKIVNIYSKEFNIDEARIRSIMKEDRIMEVAEAIEVGLATEISEPLKAVAKFKPNIKQIKMSKKDKTLKEKILAIFEDKKIKNLLVKTADQTELDFYDLDDDVTPKVGDKANVDSEKASGEYVMQDEKVFVFEDGELKTINEPTNEAEELQAKIDELQGQLSTATAKFDKKQEKLSNKLESKESELQNKKTDLKEANEKLESLKNLVSTKTVETKGKQKKKETKTSAMSDAINNLN